MIRIWLRSILTKALSGKALRRAPRPARRCYVRPRLEALEERLATSVSQVAPAWPPAPFAVPTSNTAIVSQAAEAPPPSPTAPVADAGSNSGAPGWQGLLHDTLVTPAAVNMDPAGNPAPNPEGLLRDIFYGFDGGADPASAASPATVPLPSASGPVVSLPPAAPAAEPPSTPYASPPAVGKAQRPAEPPFVPPSADPAENGAAQQPPPAPAARAEATGPQHGQDGPGGAGAIPAPARDRPEPLPPQHPQHESALADSGVAAPPADYRAPAPNAGTESTPAAAEPQRQPAPVPDGALLQRYVADGDQTAFRMLVQQHERVVFRTCQRVLGDPHLAQEAVQATFMVLARKAALLDERQPLTAWLCKVAYRAALRLRAALARRRRHERQAVKPSVVDAPLSADLERDELFRALAEELRGLPEKYRAPLVLCYLEGRTHGEAARVIGLPRGSMAKRIREGLLRLRGRLAARGFTA